MPRRADATAAVLAAVLVAALGARGRAAAAVRDGTPRLTATVDAGFDSFQERYSIVDSDTLDSIAEFRSRLALGYESGLPRSDYFHLQGMTLVGDENVEYTGQLDWTRRLGQRSSRVGAFADVTHRSFRNGTSYEFANDHTRYYFKSYAKWDGGGPLSLRLSDRVEYVDFRDRTEFDYDHAQNSVELSAEWERDLAGYLAVGVRYVTMDIPDSTQIQYEAWIPGVEFRAAPGLYKQVWLHASAERRRYAYEPARSSYWAILAGGTAEWPLTERVSVALRDETESYSYDAGTGVYFDYTESRNTLLFKYNPSWNLHAGAGPVWNVLASGASPDDEYDEVGAHLAVEYMGGSSAWMSVAYEPGRRHYRTYDGTSDEVSIYSDYTFQRVNLIASVRVWDGVSFSALVDYQPEDHEREGDDATATLVSLSLTYVY